MTYLSDISRILDEPRGLATIDVTRYEDSNTWMVTRVFVPMAHRKKGIGTSMMKELCEDADRLHQKLILEVAPYDIREFSKDDLAAWYKTFGFRPVSGEYLLRRKPAPV